MNTFHVLTGVSGELELIEAPVEQRPTFVGAGFHDGLDPILDVVRQLLAARGEELDAVVWHRVVGCGKPRDGQRG